ARARPVQRVQLVVVGRDDERQPVDHAPRGAWVLAVPDDGASGHGRSAGQGADGGASKWATPGSRANSRIPVGTALARASAAARVWAAGPGWSTKATVLRRSRPMASRRG